MKYNSGRGVSVKKREVRDLMERKKWTGRILSILLMLVMVIGLMPGMSAAALADGTKAYDAYDVTTDTNKTKSGDDLAALQVTFNGKPWYIIVDNSDSATEGTVMLLAADTSFGLSEFAPEGSNNSYNSSTVKRMLDALTASGGSFAGVADAIQPVTLETKQFDLSKEPETTSGAKLFLLSKEEANQLPLGVRKIYSAGVTGMSGDWWLRTPGAKPEFAALVLGNYNPATEGEINEGGTVVQFWCGVRPALKLNLSSVTFSSDTKTFLLNKGQHFHNGIAFEPWTSVDSLPSAQGNYYLNSDVTLSDPWEVPAGTTNLCLNGHTITVSDDKEDAIVFARNNIVLNLYDEHTGDSAGQIVSDESGVLFKESNSTTLNTFNMYGGKITGCDEGVYLDAPGACFNMYGGEISSCYYGVEINDSSASFHMHGGEITGSTRGVVNDGTFTVSGSPKITGNTGSNVYLSADKRITVTGGLTDDAAIGVTIGTSDGTGIFAVPGVPAGSQTEYTITTTDMARVTSDKADLEIGFKTENNKTVLELKKKPAYSVTITPGSNMTKTTDSGNALQPGLTGAMTDVVYTANDGYYFPTDYSVAGSNGISVTRNSYTQITVSGTPTANTSITLIAATAKTKETTPATTFTATGADSGTLSDITSGMKFSLDGGNTWTDISATSVDIASGVTTGNGIKVKKPGDGTTTTDSDLQTITVTKAETPNLTVTQPTTFSSTGSVETTTVHEYSSDGTTGWTDCNGTLTGLAQGSTRYVRVKASGTVLASDNQEVTISTFTGTKETTPNATFSATGTESGTLNDVSGGMKYSLDGGSTWVAISDTTVSISSGVTTTDGIKVYQPGNGTTTTDSDVQSITVTKAETPDLTVTQPAVFDGKGTVATTTAHEYSRDNGSNWVVCTANMEFVAGSYLIRVKANGTELASGNQSVMIGAFISATVTFKVVNGSWDEGEGEAATADKTVTLTGHEGDTLTLAANQIPSVGTKPNDTYKAGSWDVTPCMDTAITEATTYTYTYAAKEASVVTKAPEAKTLTYTGSAQELVTAGTATGGTMQYALGTDATTAPTTGYTTSIPTATDAGTYYVWYKAVGDANHSDSGVASVNVTIKEKETTKETEKTTENPTTENPKEVQQTVPDAGEQDEEGATFYPLCVRQKNVKKNSITYAWKPVNGATSYVVFGCKCGQHKANKLGTVSGTTFTWKKRKSGKSYKIYVVAMNGSSEIAKSTKVHVVTSGGRYGNAVGVSVKQKSLKVKVGKSKKIKASVKKKGPVQFHVPKVRFESTNPAVATVNQKTGKVTGVSTGTCYVYAYAQNGLCKSVKVTVKG